MVDDDPRPRPPAPDVPASRAGRLRRSLLTAAAFALGLPLAAVVAPNAWVALAARGEVATSLGDIHSRSVAIVPGSRVGDGGPLPILRDRLEAARALYAEGRVRAILVSGQQTPAAPEVSVMRAWLRGHGVPAADILTDENGTRTRETMWHAAADHGVADAVVCTQSLNMPRALFLARAAGIDAVGIALPSALSRHPRWVAIEALKTSLAVAEVAVGEPPGAGDRVQATVAAR